eukprot:1153277-Pelagomonas_calceolata.AAC.15
MLQTIMQTIQERCCRPSFKPFRKDVADHHSNHALEEVQLAVQPCPADNSTMAGMWFYHAVQPHSLQFHARQIVHPTLASMKSYPGQRACMSTLSSLPCHSESRHLPGQQVYKIGCKGVNCSVLGKSGSTVKVFSWTDAWPGSQQSSESRAGSYIHLLNSEEN